MKAITADGMRTTQIPQIPQIPPLEIHVHTLDTGAQHQN